MFNKERFPWQERDPTAALTAGPGHLPRHSGEISPGRFLLDTSSFWGEINNYFRRKAEIPVAGSCRWQGTSRMPRRARHPRKQPGALFGLYHGAAAA